jgi:hypothetical protein
MSDSLMTTCRDCGANGAVREAGSARLSRALPGAKTGFLVGQELAGRPDWARMVERL